MSRSVPEWQGRTDDDMPPPRVRARIFLAHGGKCHWSGRVIRPGEPWALDHVIALCNGGKNVESNLAPILQGKEHKEKTARDVAEKSRNYRKQLMNLGLKPKSKLQGRPFPKAPRQHSASRPLRERT